MQEELKQLSVLKLKHSLKKYPPRKNDHKTYFLKPHQ